MVDKHFSQNQSAAFRLNLNMWTIIVIVLWSSPTVYTQEAFESLGPVRFTLEESWLVHEDFPNGSLRVRNLTTGQSEDLGLTPVFRSFMVSGNWLVAFLTEGVHIRNLSTSTTNNLGFSSGSLVTSLSEHGLIFAANEEQGKDLNGDGDTDDAVFHVHDFTTGETTNLKAAIPSFNPDVERLVPRAAGTRFVFFVSEAGQGEDLNGDADTDDRVLYIHDLRTKTTENIGLGVFADHIISLSEEWLLFSVSEVMQGDDLNGDGDTDDAVPYSHNFSNGETTNLELTRWNSLGLSGDWLLIGSSETIESKDLNEDGDTNDETLSAYNLITNEVARYVSDDAFSVFGTTGVTTHSESKVAMDLNGDGDANDHVIHFYDFTTSEIFNLGLAGFPGFLVDNWLGIKVWEGGMGQDLNGDGDMKDSVLHFVDTSSLEVTNQKIAGSGFVIGSRIVMQVSETDEGEDLNDDGDIEDSILHIRSHETNQTINLKRVANVGPQNFSGDSLVLSLWENNIFVDVEVVDLKALSLSQTFVRGDSDMNKDIDITDVIFTLTHLFLGGSAPNCQDAADANDDGSIDLTDAVTTLGFLFLGQGPLPAPSLEQCGGDPSEDELGCQHFAVCP